MTEWKAKVQVTTHTGSKRLIDVRVTAKNPYEAKLQLHGQYGQGTVKHIVRA